MADDQNLPEPFSQEIDPIGPGTSVPNPKPPPEAWEEDDELDPDAPDRPIPKPDAPGPIQDQVPEDGDHAS